MGALAPFWRQASAQSFGFIDRYHSKSGEGVVTRYNTADNLTVTCFHDTVGRASILVSNGTLSRTFSLPRSADYVPVGQKYGYTVTDMQLVGTECWFCGYRWRETGKVSYEFGGLGYLERVDTGFWGCFNLSDVMDGSPDVTLVQADSVKRFTRLAAAVGGIVCVGSGQRGYSVLAECNLISTSLYICRLWKPTLFEEALVDVVCTNGRIVTLSRYNNPQHTMLYHYRFGLRYGTLSSFTSMGNVLYQYDTYYPFGDNRARFSGLDPISLASVNKGHEVTVSFVATWDTPYKGYYMIYHIADAGQAPADVVFGKEAAEAAETGGEEPRCTVSSEDTPLTVSNYPLQLVTPNPGKLNVVNPKVTDAAKMTMCTH